MRSSHLDLLSTHTWPIEPWRLVERRHDPRLSGRTETLFALANGYIGLRGNFEEGRPSERHGTLINGFHETWPIMHAEDAFGLARTGQTIVQAPDAKLIRLYVDDEPLSITQARLTHYERALDFRTGVLSRELTWTTATGCRVIVRTRRLVSYRQRHLVAISYSVKIEGGTVPLILSSWLLNRQDDNASDAGTDPEFDPRATRKLMGRVLQNQTREARGTRGILGYRTAKSRMALGCAVHHVFESPRMVKTESFAEEDWTKHVFTVEGQDGDTFRLDKYAAYHDSDTAPVRELVDRANRTLDRAIQHSFDDLVVEQTEELGRFWNDADIEVQNGDPRLQQAVRFNLFQVFQNTVRSDGKGIPAKGLTGDGYEGQYFWDMDVYVMPMLTYTMPSVARNLIAFRLKMLDAARARAAALGHRGAQFPWRTINGEEASAYYAAGTAQYHLNAGIVYGAERYVRITGDLGIIFEGGADLLVETARLWADLGFHAPDTGAFHLHSVTGPDEYTTVVNDNLYTNLMAKRNLLLSLEAMERMRKSAPEEWALLCDRLKLQPAELVAWQRAADSMYVPYDEARGLHPQDEAFLDREVWDFASTPPEKYPLLLHYHPLTIYRHQVIKQADVVLALLLVGDEFTGEQRKRNFDYYHAITTGDSSLSPCVESIIGAEVGREELALKYFEESLYMDLADVAGNVRDGAHIAAAGGTWMALVFGFAGLRESRGRLRLDPRLPASWSRLALRLTVRGRHIQLTLTPGTLSLRMLNQADSIDFDVRDDRVKLVAGRELVLDV